jgi:uncharacterized protein YpmS
MTSRIISPCCGWFNLNVWLHIYIYIHNMHILCNQQSNNPHVFLVKACYSKIMCYSKISHVYPLVIKHGHEQFPNSFNAFPTETSIYMHFLPHPIQNPLNNSISLYFMAASMHSISRHKAIVNIINMYQLIRWAATH